MIFDFSNEKPCKISFSILFMGENNFNFVDSDRRLLTRIYLVNLGRDLRIFLKNLVRRAQFFYVSILWFNERKLWKSKYK